jgi:hypothetical protein
MSCQFGLSALLVVPELCEKCSAFLGVAVRQKDAFARLFLGRLLDNFLFAF